MHGLKVFKNRKTAAVILALVILAATPLGAYLSLNKAAQRIEDGFYEGVYLDDQGYTAGSMDTYLSDASRAALGLVTAGSNYDALDAETHELRSARESLLSAGTIEEKYLANERMRAAFEAFSAAFPGAVPSDYDQESFDTYSELFTQSQSAMEHSGYNESVDSFVSSVMGAFPAKLIAAVFSIDPPESFGVNK